MSLVARCSQGGDVPTIDTVEPSANGEQLLHEGGEEVGGVAGRLHVCPEVVVRFQRRVRLLKHVLNHPLLVDAVRRGAAGRLVSRAAEKGRHHGRR